MRVLLRTVHLLALAAIAFLAAGWPLLNGFDGEAGAARTAYLFVLAVWLGSIVALCTARARRPATGDSPCR